MFKKRFFRRGNKPGHSNFLESGEKQQEQHFIPPVQTKLSIGKPGDRYETEADTMADRVVNNQSPSESVQKADEEEENIQAKALAGEITPIVQKQIEKEEEEPLQTKMEEEEEEVQMQPEEEEEMVQQKSSGNLKTSPKSFEKQLKKTTSQGEGLSSEVKKDMEYGFGTNFSEVRLHNDSNADSMNRLLGARAFTHGRDIYFKTGEFQQGDKQGKHLLAHELTHTLQQGAVKGKTLNDSKASAKTVQRKEISYRKLTWQDFEGTPPEDAAYDANTNSGIKYYDNKIIDGQFRWNGKDKVVVTITFDSTKASFSSFMDTVESWKKEWITSDEEAKKKFGKDANIDMERKSLLAHEQIHFKITDAIAKKYRAKFLAAIPKKNNVEKGMASSDADAQAFFDTLIDKKNDELRIAFKTVTDEANAHNKEIQAIYETDTDHSGIAKSQKQWENNFKKSMKAAIKKAKLNNKATDI